VSASIIPESRVVNTEYGPLRVDLWLLSLWNINGWPASHVIKQMVEDQPCGPATAPAAGDQPHA
jgi:hypothetical protein